MNLVKSFDFDGLSKSMECPILNIPLTEAVHLHPCAHKISLAAMREMEKLKTQSNCPLCRESVSLYYLDHTFSSLVTMLCDLQVKKSWAQFVNNVQGANPLVDNYPAMRGTFSVKPSISQNRLFKPWQVFEDESIIGNDAIRSMKFTSDTRGSLVTQVSVYGYGDGSIKITIVCDGKEKQRIFSSYLEQVGFPKEDLSQKVEDLKKIFQVLTLNNTFPEEEISLLRSIVEEGGNWKLVTPFSEEEIKTYEYWMAKRSSLKVSAKPFIPNAKQLSPSAVEFVPKVNKVYNTEPRYVYYERSW